MKIQVSQAPRKQNLQLRDRVYRVAAHGMIDHSGKYAAPTEAERRFVSTSFILGGLSIFTAFFPVCGLPIAIAGLVMGVAGRRRVGGLYRMATWAVALSIVGLVLAVLNIVISVSIYFSTYVWG